MGFPIAGFQDQCLKPLGHASREEEANCIRRPRMEVRLTAPVNPPVCPQVNPARRQAHRLPRRVPPTSRTMNAKTRRQLEILREVLVALVVLVSVGAAALLAQA